VYQEYTQKNHNCSVSLLDIIWSFLKKGKRIFSTCAMKFLDFFIGFRRSFNSEYFISTKAANFMNNPG
jgi:hypothetical protein